jgi:hypothetical protein
VQYPGRSKVEAAARPFGILIGNQVMRTRMLDILGWWELRQHYSRAELIEGGVASRTAAYRHEQHFAQLVGMPIDQATRADIDRWVKGLRHQGDQS